ncbi:MAG: CoA transferase [Alphaproteobacteria bacterium]|nr:CoA transferase [Alphaproteobacteria bacterium]
MAANPGVSASMMPLDDIVVLDLTKMMAGPICTQYLADLGAEVIKVEDTGIGDDMRNMPPFVGDDGAMFVAVNRNKRSIALDLKTPEGQAAVRALARRADVLVESYATGVTDRLGIPPGLLRAEDPRLIYCSISGFGRTGPLAKRPAYELILQAFTGIMSVTGEADGPPLRIAFSPLDQTTGIHAATGILAAIRRRDRTGEGAYVEASLLDTATAFLAWHAQSWWETGELPRRMGSAHGSLCPYQAFRVADGYILIAVGSDRLWGALCDALGMPGMRDDPRFRTNADRVRHFAETVALVQQAVVRHPLAHWLALFEAAGIPAAPVNTIDRLLSEPQLEQSGMIMHYQHPVGGAMRAIAYPVAIDGLPRAVRRPPPLHGEHTDEILAEAGYAADDIARLRGAGIAGRRGRP